LSADERIGIMLGRFGETEVEEAIMAGDSRRLRSLLEAGHDADGRDSLGVSYLWLASQQDDGGSMLRLLVEFGADIDGAVDERGTLLHHAASAGNSADLVSTLLDLGASVDAVDPHGYTPLHTAAMYGDTRVVRLLLDAGADRTARTTEGQTAADLAMRNNYGAVETLLKV
jgi:ankyrin repeat protein